MHNFILLLVEIKNNLVKQNSKIATIFSSFLSKFEFLTPNVITIIAFIISGIIGSFLIILKFYTLGGVVILFGFWLDSVDGNFARMNGMVTPKGAVLDSVLDRYSDLFILSAIIISDPKILIPGLLSIIGTVMVPYVRARIEGTGAKASGTFGSREIRCVIILAGLIFHIVYTSIVILAIISNASALHRLYKFLKT